MFVLDYVQALSHTETDQKFQRHHKFLGHFVLCNLRLNASKLAKSLMPMVEVDT